MIYYIALRTNAFDAVSVLHTVFFTGTVEKGLSGEQFAAVIKVGDRVKRGRDWMRGDQVH